MNNRPMNIGIVTQTGAGIANNQMEPHQAILHQPPTVAITPKMLEPGFGGSAHSIHDLRSMRGK